MRLTDSLRRRLRAWLAIPDLTEHRALIDGQRRDFDRLGQVLTDKDADVAGVREQLDALNRGAGTAINHLNQRLRSYELNVPAIARVRKALDEKAKREHARRERLILEHPELSDEGKAHVRQIGLLPTEPEPPSTTESSDTAERTLALVREGDGGGHLDSA